MPEGQRIRRGPCAIRRQAGHWRPRLPCGRGLAQSAPIAEGVASTTVTIAGGDGNDLTLYISRPADTDGPLPGVVHLHGGGMAILSAADSTFVRWRENLAATGLVVVGVEFRNSAGKLGVHPYPAGLND